MYSSLTPTPPVDSGCEKQLGTPQETASRHQARSRQAWSAWTATRVPEAQAERLLALFHGFNRPSDLLRRSARTPRLRSAPKVTKKSEEGSRRSSGERRISTGGELKRSKNVGGGRDRKIGSTMKTHRSSGHRLPSKKWAGTAESREMSVRVRRTAGITHKDQHLQRRPAATTGNQVVQYPSGTYKLRGPRRRHQDRTVQKRLRLSSLPPTARPTARSSLPQRRSSTDRRNHKIDRQQPLTRKPSGSQHSKTQPATQQVKPLNVQTKQPTGAPTKDAAIKQAELALTKKDPNEKPAKVRRVCDDTTVTDARVRWIASRCAFAWVGDIACLRMAGRMMLGI